jgi:hypothetical protein
VGVVPAAGVVTVGVGTAVPMATMDSRGTAVGLTDASETERVAAGLATEDAAEVEPEAEPLDALLAEGP